MLADQFISVPVVGFKVGVVKLETFLRYPANPFLQDFREEEEEKNQTFVAVYSYVNNVFISGYISIM